MNQEFKNKLEKITDNFRGEVASLRTGRATPALVEDVEVDYYGVKTPLKALASISCPDPRQLVIQPWDKKAVQPIEKAIQVSNLGINPVADRDSIRLSLPSLTEEKRKELVKILGKYLEETRIKIRQAREDLFRNIDRREKSKEISEDQKFRERRESQKLVDEYNKKTEEIGDKKEKEVMTV